MVVEGNKEGYVPERKLKVPLKGAHKKGLWVHTTSISYYNWLLLVQLRLLLDILILFSFATKSPEEVNG